MPSSTISLAYSTCPNDTFIFNRLRQDVDIETHLHDVETLNRRAFKARFDITKLSFHAWLLLRDRYELLQSGSALGRGCGPLVITKDAAELHPESVVAVPGEYTTAHLLLRLWNPKIKNRMFMPFDEIMEAVAGGRADAGVIIHEGRFVYKERGFTCLQDLGDWWETKTGKPIPLGCIAAKKSLGQDRIAGLDQRVKASVQAAFDDPAATRAYVKSHAQELDDAVIEQHIQTYVNDFTLELGAEGREALEVLLEMAKAAGVIA